ncbi:hypothetical protein JB92DRAFT_2842137, partial [Gautieria morchelliformis]
MAAALVSDHWRWRMTVLVAHVIWVHSLRTILSKGNFNATRTASTGIHTHCSKLFAPAPTLNIMEDNVGSPALNSDNLNRDTVSRLSIENTHTAPSMVTLATRTLSGPRRCRHTNICPSTHSSTISSAERQQRSWRLSAVPSSTRAPCLHPTTAFDPLTIRSCKALQLVHLGISDD